MFKFQPTAIVWDLDGTLVDSAPDLASALNTVLDTIVIPGGKLAIAMQLILTPMILRLMERRRRAR